LAISRLVDQCSDQSQQLLLLRAVASTEENSDLDFGHMPTRREVGLVSDEHSPRIGITGEMPSITVRAVIKLSGKKGHPCCSCAIATGFKRIEDMLSGALTQRAVGFGRIRRNLGTIASAAQAQRL
jgi:hypothetical protein